MMSPNLKFAMIEYGTEQEQYFIESASKHAKQALHCARHGYKSMARVLISEAEQALKEAQVCHDYIKALVYGDQ